MTELEFGLLGPLLVRRGGTVIPVPRGNQRTILAELLLAANQVVAVDRIAETLWGAGPPPSAQVTIRNYVKRLRRALGDEGQARIIAQPRGYLINVGAQELDLTRFEALLGSARAAAAERSWDDAAARARAALALWRGRPLADVEADVLTVRNVPRLEELRLQALETRIDADLHRGRHAELTAELAELAGAHPLRERLHAQLMLALYRSGRQAEALAAYGRARRTLVDELAAEPGPELRELHRQILAADPALTPARPATAAAPAVPRQLPGTAAHFSGRAGELAALTRILDRAAAEAPGTVVISAIGGTAGVGKTALAVRWAHQVADRFPGGQLYVNLRGFDPSGTPVAPAEAIRGFLDALGVSPGRIPASLEAQTGLYRSLIAGQRLLILLDNARDERQVRPLLPASPGCLVLATSRNELGGLAASEGARLITLDVLTDAEARALLAVRLGAERVAAEPAAVAEITRLCARLPLALAIAAARAGARPSFPLAAIAAELRDSRGRLDAFDTGDPAGSVRAVFSWSSGQLTPPAARMFALLGLHPGPDISVPAAASLAGVSPGRARQAVAELTRAHLLAEPAPGRFGLHDLLRAYAAEQAAVAVDDDARSAAASRVLDHYLHTGHAAAVLLSPNRAAPALDPPLGGTSAETFADRDLAMTWFEAEHHVLLAVISSAAGAGLSGYAWELAWTLSGFLYWRGHWHDLCDSQETALAAAEALGDRPGQAFSHRYLGRAWLRLGSRPDSHAHLQRALALYRQAGDQDGEANTNINLAQVLDLETRYEEALRHNEEALRLFRRCGDRAGQVVALNNSGWLYGHLGQYRRAVSCCLRALRLETGLDNRRNEAATWGTLGYLRVQLGEHAAAVTAYERSAQRFAELGDRFDEAEALRQLGNVHQADGDLPLAREVWRRSLSILDDLQHPNADLVRARLAAVG